MMPMAAAAAGEAQDQPPQPQHQQQTPTQHSSPSSVSVLDHGVLQAVLFGVKRFVAGLAAARQKQQHHATEQLHKQLAAVHDIIIWQEAQRQQQQQDSEQLEEGQYTAADCDSADFNADDAEVLSPGQLRASSGSFSDSLSVCSSGELCLPPWCGAAAQDRAGSHSSNHSSNSNDAAGAAISSNGKRSGIGSFAASDCLYPETSCSDYQSPEPPYTDEPSGTDTVGSCVSYGREDVANDSSSTLDRAAGRHTSSMIQAEAAAAAATDAEPAECTSNPATPAEARHMEYGWHHSPTATAATADAHAAAGDGVPRPGGSSPMPAADTALSALLDVPDMAELIGPANLHTLLCLMQQQRQEQQQTIRASTLQHIADLTPGQPLREYGGIEALLDFEQCSTDAVLQYWRARVTAGWAAAPSMTAPCGTAAEQDRAAVAVDEQLTAGAPSAADTDGAGWGSSSSSSTSGNSSADDTTDSSADDTTDSGAVSGSSWQGQLLFELLLDHAGLDIDDALNLVRSCQELHLLLLHLEACSIAAAGRRVHGRLEALVKSPQPSSSGGSSSGGSGGSSGGSATEQAIGGTTCTPYVLEDSALSPPELHAACAYATDTAELQKFTTAFDSWDSGSFSTFAADWSQRLGPLASCQLAAWLVRAALQQLPGQVQLLPTGSSAAAAPVGSSPKLRENLLRRMKRLQLLLWRLSELCHFSEPGGQHDEEQQHSQLFQQQQQQHLLLRLLQVVLPDANARALQKSAMEVVIRCQMRHELLVAVHAVSTGSGSSRDMDSSAIGDACHLHWAAPTAALHSLFDDLIHQALAPFMDQLYKPFDQHLMAAHLFEADSRLYSSSHNGPSSSAASAGSSNSSSYRELLALQVEMYLRHSHAPPPGSLVPLLVAVETALCSSLGKLLSAAARVQDTSEQLAAMAGSGAELCRA